MNRFQPFTVDRIEPATKNINRYFLKAESGTARRFLPGQCLFLRTEAKGVVAGRAYSIASAPKDAEEGVYEIDVQSGEGMGFVSDAIFDNWKEGDVIRCSRPEGGFYYRPGVDKENIVAISGGVGITPFLSMARALSDQTVDSPKTLTIIACDASEDGFFFREELDALQRQRDDFRIFYVAEKPSRDDVFEGLVSEELLRRLPLDLENSTFLGCGPRGMVKALQRIFEKMGLLDALRFDFGGEEQEVYLHPEFPEEAKGRVFNVTVIRKGATTTVPADSSESLLTALERAGLAPISGCRSGRCGYCMAKYRSGDIFIPKERDHRTEHQKSAGFINLCCCFALGDVSVELPY